MSFNNVTYTSKLYKTTKSVDYALQLRSGDYGTAKFYCFENNTKYVCIEKFEVCLVSTQIIRVKSTKLPSFVKIDEVKTKVMYMTLKNDLQIFKEYISIIPNHFEKT